MRLRNFLVTTSAILACTGLALATEIPRLSNTGFALQQGSYINQIVDEVNLLSGSTIGPLTVTAINGADSSLDITGKAGSAAAAGGTASLVGGAGGSTSGAGGAVAITAGTTTTSGAGGAVTITAGAGKASTNAGGSIDLVPGAAVSTGIPGTVKVHGDSNLMCGTYYFTGTPAATSQVFYLATRALMVTSISEIHSTAAGGTSTLDVTKDTSTGAPASGSALTSAAFNLASTANTVQSGSVTATVATKTLAAGDRLSVKFNHAIQSSAGVVVTACMTPL